MTFQKPVWDIRWVLRADMNRDEILTTSDAWLWCCYFVYAPGDWAIYGMSRFPGLTQFFELTPGAYYSGWSLAISLSAWASMWCLWRSATKGL